MDKQKWKVKYLEQCVLYIAFFSCDDWQFLSDLSQGKSYEHDTSCHIKGAVYNMKLCILTDTLEKTNTAAQNLLKKTTTQ